MFRKYPLQQIRYGVCVLQADEPKDCPWKVKLFIKKHSRRLRLQIAYYYRKVATFRFKEEEDDRGPFPCTSHVTGMDLQPLFRAYGRSREGTEMKISIIWRGGRKTTIRLLLENFLERLASRGQHNKKFILYLTEEDVVVENVLTLPGEVEDERKGEAECQEEEEQSEDEESNDGEKSRSDDDQETDEGTEEVQGNIREGRDDETEKEMQENKTEETKEDDAVEGQMNKGNTHEEIKIDIKKKKTKGSATTISEMKEDDDSQHVIKRRVRKSNEEDQKGVREAPSPQRSSGSDVSKVRCHYSRFAAQVFLLMVVMVVLVLSLVKHCEP